MAIQLSKALPHDQRRYEPTAKWIRASLGGETVVESKRALVLWEPGAVVPGYAFPREDVRSEALPGGAVTPLDDPDLDGLVTVAWHAPDAWYEEDEPIVGHPRDPFHRIDVRESTRHVRVELDGEAIAESRRPQLLFETYLPTRFYLPEEDVDMSRLTPTDHKTECAYKGEASYWSVEAGGKLHENLAWTYTEPLADSRQITGMIAFFNERSDISVDGEPAGRPRTQWS